MMDVINPANGKKLRTHDEWSADKANEVIEDVYKAWTSWRNTSINERATHMREVGRLLKQDKEKLARLMTEEMGKVYKEGIAEVEKCAWTCEYFADHAGDFLKSETIESDAHESDVTYEPMGVVLAIMPWNFPLWQVIRFAAPSLMAGNVGVLKHASNVPGCGVALEELFNRAGFPENVFRYLPISSDTSADVIANPKVSAVTLTGSTQAGKIVAAQAGKHLKKSVLELGGSDPYVILADADLDNAAETCVNSRLINNGQSCIAAKRFIVVEEVQEQFIKKVVDLMESKTMGDPDKKDTDLGPLARKDLREELHKQVQKSVDMGAKVLTGGVIPEGDGYYYPPTVLTDVPENAPAYHEELFGPVATVIVVKNEEEAIDVANATVYGLGAAVFTEDKEKGKSIAETKLRAGSCFVNSLVKSDPRLPFGGIKESGYGRELSYFGIKEFVNIKTIYVK